MEMPFAWWSLGVKQNVLRELREPFFWCFFWCKKHQAKDLPSLKWELLKEGGKLLKIFEWCPHTRPNLSQRKSHTHLKSMDQSDVCNNTGTKKLDAGHVDRWNSTKPMRLAMDTFWASRMASRGRSRGVNHQILFESSWNADETQPFWMYPVLSSIIFYPILSVSWKPLQKNSSWSWKPCISGTPGHRGTQWSLRCCLAFPASSGPQGSTRLLKRHHFASPILFVGGVVRQFQTKPIEAIFAPSQTNFAVIKVLEPSCEFSEIMDGDPQDSWQDPLIPPFPRSR